MAFIQIKRKKYIVSLFTHILPFLVFFILSCRSELPYGVISFYSKAFPLAFLITLLLLFKILWQTGAQKVSYMYQFHHLISSGFSRNFPISFLIEFTGIKFILFLYYIFNIVVFCSVSHFSSSDIGNLCFLYFSLNEVC